ncbi:hypothetical protein Mgra_00002104 [Meloidogyne graminicola]|uniref:Uncharacterized protein n=1 Tax=Meloidogyne graminicola TaxID=189291 RepID=A0A8S9ZZI8_9BILA|nr:hypothetical protein Mgra_00002104 [Meloidogyne graminicola]
MKELIRDFGKNSLLSFSSLTKWGNINTSNFIDTLKFVKIALIPVSVPLSNKSINKRPDISPRRKRSPNFLYFPKKQHL